MIELTIFVVCFIGMSIIALCVLEITAESDYDAINGVRPYCPDDGRAMHVVTVRPSTVLFRCPVCGRRKVVRKCGC